KTCNNDKSLSEIQLEHEKEDEFVVVVVKVVHKCRHWMDLCVNQEWWRCCGVGWSFDLLRDCMMVVKEIVGRLLEEEEVSHFRKEVMILHFHTCLTVILGFLEKLERWFEQDFDKEEERFEGDEDGGEV
ncbi:hypothetical protein Tco_1039079, partial [Tanacetum coccineum]